MSFFSRQRVHNKEMDEGIKAGTNRTYKEYLYTIHLDARDTRELFDVVKRVYG